MIVLDVKYILREKLGSDASNRPGGTASGPGIKSAGLAVRLAAIHTTAKSLTK